MRIRARQLPENERKIQTLIKPPASTFTGGLNLIHIQWNVPFRIYYAFKTIGIKAYVLGGLYLAFLEMLKIKMFRYASGGPYLSFLDYK